MKHLLPSIHRHRCQASPSAQSGFTLLEVLVVVIIVGILAAIAAPSWLGFLNRQRVGSIRSDLVQTLRSAQQDARQRRQVVTVAVTNDEGQPTLRINDLPQVLGSDSNPGNVTLTPFGFTDGTKDTAITAISFDYQGIPTGNVPFVIDISAAGSSARQCVRVETLLGTIKTTDGATCDSPSLDN